ncbi:hypothetical protein NDI54_13720 [Haloarcula sp. S1AR25-5A]|uniref:Uncharacterized protein n=1 Tax=Haloarcula terrestris TaxID=2950533 RepID=A0AAE4EY83_9EURY|nr:hypothetical protein [Haloarcula terrestris]MDS0222401.1 hypothetical protein [Haloarcula terrestris]
MGFDAVGSLALSVLGLPAEPGSLVVGQLGPATELSRPLRALVSFVVVLVIGALVLRLRRDSLDEAIDAISDSPATAVLYGVAGYVIVGIVALYGTTTLAQMSVAGGILVRLGIIIGGAFLLILTAFGFLVVGTLLTQLLRGRHPARGLLLGASLSAITWVLFSPAGSIVSSLAIAAFGIGGSARVWIHSERTVETELNGR